MFTPLVGDFGPAHDEICSRAIALAPRWASRAHTADRHSRLPDVAIQELFDAELLQILAPRRYGGLELGWPTLAEAGRVASRACASTGWMITLVGGHMATVGRLSLACQDWIFANGPRQLVATGAPAGTGQIRRANGGVVLNGTWRFASGIDHASWIVVPGALSTEDGSGARPVVYKMLVPSNGVEVIRNWDMPGMRATGSEDVSFVEMFVPDANVVSKDTCFGAHPAGASVNPNGYMFDVPLLSYSTSWIVGPLLGCAEGAIAHYVGSLRQRCGSAGEPSTIERQRLAESLAELSCAQQLYKGLAAKLHSAGLARVPISSVEHATIRRDRAYLAQLCLNAVERIIRQMGASTASNTNPTQRQWRDLQVMASHIDISRDAAFLNYSAQLLQSGEAPVRSREL